MIVYQAAAVGLIVACGLNPLIQWLSERYFDRHRPRRRW